ncbi:MAG: hypothetical protein KBA15_12125 [Spirochaetes bacterium]|jgi:hypothetical protein|nr:hypothetical protein [Spirochaetota bacterium]
MGNENEIRDIEPREDGTSIFLPEAIQDPEGKPPEYSLNNEFARTKKNRNYGFYLLVAGFMVALIAGTLMLAQLIQERFNREEVEISAFEDMRLIEILDKAKRLENELEVARNRLNDTRGTMNDELARARDDETRAAIRAKYAARIKNQQQEVAGLQQKLDAHDVRLQENIKKAEAIVSNYQKLHNIEMEKQKRYYENRIAETVLKYNPHFTERELRRILEDKKPPLDKNVPRLNDFKKELASDARYSEAEFTEMRRMQSDQQSIIRRMNRIPYINSVAPSLDKIEYFSRELTGRYEKMWGGLADSVRVKSAHLNHFRYAFDYLARTEPESGYIVDPRDPDAIYVHLRAVHMVKDGTTALVFRKDDEYVGRIQFYAGSAGIMARVVEVQEGRKIQPFDRILIKVQQE